MSISINSKWKNDKGDIVNVIDIQTVSKYYSGIDYSIDCVLFVENTNSVFRILTWSEFEDTFKPYTTVYEYQYAMHCTFGGTIADSIGGTIIFEDKVITSTSGAYYTDDEKKPSHWITSQRLDFTKRERK